MASRQVEAKREAALIRGESMFHAVPPPVVLAPEWHKLDVAIPPKHHRCVVVDLTAGQFTADGAPITTPLVIKEDLTHMGRGVKRLAFCACGGEQRVSQWGVPISPWQNRNLRREDAWSARPDWAGPLLGAAVVLAAILFVSLLLAT